MTVATLHFGKGLLAGDGTRLKAPTADGSSGQVLQTDGSGQLSFASVSASPGGVSGDIQFNNGGVFDGFGDYNGSKLTLDVDFELDSNGNVAIFRGDHNQGGANNTDFLIDGSTRDATLLSRDRNNNVIGKWFTGSGAMLFQVESGTGRDLRLATAGQTNVEFRTDQTVRMTLNGTGDLVMSTPIQLDNAAVSESINTTHTLQVKDSNGTLYKIPVVAA